MAQAGVQPERERFSCSICLYLLKDPVTTACGHSYCMSCIKDFWDGENQKGTYSCPQCRETFSQRPVLKKTTLLAELVEDLKKIRAKDSPADHCYAGPGDVACDVCTGRKMKATKSCLVCLVSYCQNHLQPHYDVPDLKKHNLLDPSENLQQNICSRHDEVMKIFCRTDQKCICYRCLMEEHKGHETALPAAERAEKQKKLQVSRQQIQQTIQDQEKIVKLLQQELKAINDSADKIVKDSEKIFTGMIRLLQKRSSEVKQQIRSQQKTEVSRVKYVQGKLEKEISELKRKDAELEHLLHTQDHTQFLLNYPSLPAPRGSNRPSIINVRPLRHFEDVTAAVSELREKLQDVLRNTWINISLPIYQVDVLLSEPKPKTRNDFLKYFKVITLDPNTAERRVLLSEENRKVRKMKKVQLYPDHPDRFIELSQVLSTNSLTGRCYWEVEWKGEVDLAVSYKNISKSGNKNDFRYNDKSWSLYCNGSSYTFYHDSGGIDVSGPDSSRIGVYLDHTAGILSFYSVSETMTLLHRVWTTFTQPLHAGVGFYKTGDSAEFLQLI